MAVQEVLQQVHEEFSIISTHAGFVPGRGGMGPGGLRGAFFSPAFSAERGRSLPALSPFLISDGFSGKEVGLSSEGRFGNLLSIAFGAGLSGTFG